jgi:hypothetical protein
LARIRAKMGELCSTSIFSSFRRPPYHHWSVTPLLPAVGLINS